MRELAIRILRLKEKIEDKQEEGRRVRDDLKGLVERYEALCHELLETVAEEG